MKDKKLPLISVIIPCYNVKDYVRKALDSVLSQSYENIEIIAVDDFSKDGTYEILKEYEEKYREKITLIRNDANSGSAAYSRNVALKIAKGDYIGFIDPDDYIDKDYYNNLCSALKENDAEISFTDIVLVDEKGNVLNGPIKCYEGDEINVQSVLNSGLSASPCNKLFKADIIKRYPFLVGKMNEDVASVIPAIVATKGKIAYANEEKYYYVQRKNSAQNSEFSDRRFDMFDAISVCFERIREFDSFERNSQIILYHQVLMLFTCVIIEIKDKKQRKDIIEKFIKKQEAYKVESNFMLKHYIRCQRKVLRLYYLLVVKSLKFKSASFTNFIISAKDGIYDMCRYIKRAFKRLIGKNVIKYNIGLKDVIKAAKKQSEMKENDIKVSVVIPNYNYADFMYQRIYSILNQTVKLHEIIVLDDCSKDASREVIDKIVENVKDYVNIKTIYNEQNSGSPFKQWRKGFKEAKGDYVWIAEADDYCDKKMIESLCSKIKEDRNIQIAYVDTAFIDKFGNIILKTIKPEIDLMKTGHWNSSFVDNGKEEIEKYAFLNCIIANVSSCIIKNQNYDDVFEKISSYSQAGDYLFYNLVMLKGDICFENSPMNYYRMHGNNVTSTTKKQKHFDELVRIHDENRKLIKFTSWHEEQVKKRYEFLKRVWNLEN